jgi:hypothetical protein
MRGRWIVLVVLALVASLHRIAAAQERAPDEISQLLFDAYIARPGKINTSTVMAASQIIADRGRESGFWKNVLAELQKGDERNEIGCVRILGNMLAGDASARDALRRQKESGELLASTPSIRLGKEVVAELLERANKADRFRSDHYAIALARAKVPDAREYLASILIARRAPAPPAVAGGESAPVGFYHLESTRFHAAVGLAQLGDAAGLEWLIAHCHEVNGHVSHARPYGTSQGGSLGSCCTAALQQLSGESSLTARAEWEAWAKTADKSLLTVRSVPLEDL